MSQKCAPAIKINQDLCGKCTVCYSICPYEAIKRDLETGKVEIDLPKCQVCGICYAACPVMAIEIVYYDYESLLKYLGETQKKCRSDTLVLMCRGNSPSNFEVDEILKEHGLNVENYIPLRLPCAGRVPAEFIFKALKKGIKKVVSIQCEDSYCRFKQGTKLGARRLVLGRKVLRQFGIDENAFMVFKHSRKVAYDTTKCVGCDKCVFICPYKAIEAEPFATPKVLNESCMGCGACALVCPHKAIEVKGFEFENTLKRYIEAAQKLKAHETSPLVLVFVCQWSEFPILDNLDDQLFRRKVVTMEIPCFKALDPVHVVNALQNGFDGVMAVVCPSDDCKLQEGKETAERNVEVLKDVLKKMNLLERFELVKVSPRCVGDFGQRFGEFYQRITAMPKTTQMKLEAKSHV